MLSTELKDVLIKTTLCEHLDSNELDMLISHSKIISFAAGDTILQQGKISDGMYIILEGTAVVTAKILGKGVTTLVTLQFGNFVGLMSTIGKWPNATSVIANGQVQCLLMTNIYLEMLSLFSPETKYKIIRAVTKEISERLKNMHNKITTFMKQADMATRSLFSEVIKSLTKPEPITYEQASINLNLLKNVQPFDAFSNEEYDTLIKHGSLITAAKQCTLVQEKEKTLSCYIIIRGAVQSSIIQDNKLAKLSVLCPMNLFCSIPSIDDTSFSIINYSTCERALLFKVNDSNLVMIRNNNKELWFKISELICKSYASLQRSAEKLDIRLNSELYNNR